jgi:hypothetical protein
MTVRVFHLGGGCRAVQARERLHLQPLALNGKVAGFPLPSPDSAYSIIQSANLKIIGTDDYSRPEQIDGRQLPDWRPHSTTEQSSSPAGGADMWSCFGYAAFQLGNGQLWDITRRVCHQLRTCEWRLREISESYSRLLLARVESKTFTAGNRVKDGFTRLAYLAIQSLLTDSCVLCDYFAEYRALVLQHEIRPIGVPPDPQSFRRSLACFEIPFRVFSSLRPK